ncbi:hypothetical protein Fcan01_06682 [Folsomia candida]|uniref:Uncharacterized protein n=1 Tax=Folsomia candida TaxID=158441 RepID=A0A226EKK2_FOLCA|nr:hypothetical protein Fcan01_06682 [Folsomia candida]
MASQLSTIIVATCTLLLLSILKPSSGQGLPILTPEYLAIKLPSPNSCLTPFYDGNDSIYLFGGCEENNRNQILVYSIISEVIRFVGTLPTSGMNGHVQGDRAGNMYYIGGLNNGEEWTQVVKFSPATNTTSVVVTLPFSVQDSTSVKYNGTSNTIYIIGGDANPTSLMALDLSLSTHSTVATLPFGIHQAASFRYGNKAYVFDAGTGENQTTAMELDLDTFRMMSVGPSTLPRIILFPSLVFDGNLFAYLIGGYRPDSPPVTPSEGIIQFNPITFEHAFVPVRNYPISGNYFYHSPASVYVARNNRIYCFGVSTFNVTADRLVARDEIFKIDLTPLNLPSTSTVATRN